MNQFELNVIRSRLRKIGVDEDFIRRYLRKLELDNEPYATALRKIENWEKQDSSQFVLQVLACGVVAAVAGGALAVLQQ